MAAINFFCPCCLSQPKYSRALGLQVVKIISEVYGVDPDWVLTGKGKTSAGSKARGRTRHFSIHYLRRITGENYKVICELFGISAANAGWEDLRLTRYLITSKADQEKRDEIESALYDHFKNLVL